MTSSIPLSENSSPRPVARTLLLVDDEPNVLNALTRLLRSEGIEILRAESGEAAIKLLESRKVGVIVSDQRMPGMSGIEFLRHAKLIYPDTVRMVLSGYTDLKSVTDAINEGAVYKFLTKPWEDEQVRASIREAFGHYELRAENTRLAEELARANEQLSLAKVRLEGEVEHSIGVLRVSQEMIELLPVGAIGIDQEGFVVIANHKAEEILDCMEARPLIGVLATERLPAEMQTCLARVMGGESTARGTWYSPCGEEFEFSCIIMGSHSHSKGVLVAIMPITQRCA